MILLAHITPDEGPGIVAVLLIGVAVGVVLGLAVMTVRAQRRR